MTDSFVVRVVAAGLAVVVVGAVLAASLLASIDKEVPALVADLSKVALGALGSLLASTRSNDTPAPVVVMNEPRDAVPVETAPPAKRGK